MVVLNDVNHATWFNIGDEIWYHWYTMIPKNEAIKDTWHILTQWHSPTDNKSNSPDCHNPENVTTDFNMNCGTSGVPVVFNLINSTRPNNYDSVCKNLRGLTLELELVNKTE